MFSVEILGTGSVLSGRTIETASLVEEVFPGRDPTPYVEKTGIRERRWVDRGMTHARHGAQALAAACADAGIEPAALRRIIFVNSFAGDRVIPATVSALMAELGLSGSCDGFDLNNACMGFLTGLDLAARSVATGLGPVGVVSVEHPSKWIAPAYHRSYFVFGDAAAAAVIGAGEGRMALFQRNDGTLPSGAWLEYGAPYSGDALMQFNTSSKNMTGVAIEALRKSAQAVLDDAGLTLDEIEWVLPHQPNGRMFDRALDVLGVRPDQAIRVVDYIGSSGSAAIPFSLDRLRKERDVRPGDRILSLGVGTGITYGAMLYEVPR